MTSNLNVLYDVAKCQNNVASSTHIYYLKEQNCTGKHLNLKTIGELNMFTHFQFWVKTEDLYTTTKPHPTLQERISKQATIKNNYDSLLSSY